MDTKTNDGSEDAKPAKSSNHGISYNSLDSADLLTGNGNRTELMQNLKREALKHYLWVIDLKPGTFTTEHETELFEICLPYINVVFDEFGDREKRLIAEKIRELVLDKARDQIEYFKQNHHEYKNIFRVDDIDRDVVMRLTTQNQLLTVSREKEKNNRPVNGAELHAFVSEIMTRLRTPEGRRIVETIFDTKIAYRNVNNCMPLDAYKEQLIDKLLYQTEIYLVENGLYLVPGLPDVLVNTRRNVTRHVSAEEGAIRFNKTDKQVLAMGRDKQFWAEMAKVAHEIEPMNPRRPPNEQYLRIERVYRKAMQLRVDDNSRRGMQPLLLHFMYRCFDDLDVLFKQYPDADDDEMLRRSWPIILKHAEELIQIDAFNKGGIKDIFRDYDVYCEKVTRNTPDGRVLIPRHGKLSRVATQEEMREAQPILDLTMKTRNPELLRKLFDKYLRWRLERMEVTQDAINIYREKLIAYIMNEMHIDVVRDKNSLISHTTTTAHARSGFTRKFDYDGKLYGVWIGEMRIRTLSLAEKGPEILAWILLEEAQHFSPDGEIFKSHPENREKILVKTSDYLEMVEHGIIYEMVMSSFYNLIDNAQKAYPDFNEFLRMHSIQRTNNPGMKVLEDGVRYFLDSGIRNYLEDVSIPYEMKVNKLSNDIRALILRHMSQPDTRLKELSVVIINAIITYLKNYLKHRTDGIRFEKGYEIAYLKSAHPPTQP
jgi:hypothetical protein